MATIKNISATHLDGNPIEKDSVHEVADHIARNLIRDGRAVAFDAIEEDEAPQDVPAKKRSAKK